MLLCFIVVVVLPSREYLRDFRTFSFDVLLKEQILLVDSSMFVPGIEA